MQNLTELEVENLRHLIGGHATIINKLEQYAQTCTDPQLKQMLQKRCARCTKYETTINDFLRIGGSER